MNSSDKGEQNDAKNGTSDSEAGPRRLNEEEAGNGKAQGVSDAEKFKNEYLYLRAEFENYKRQSIKERSDLRKYGSERLVADILGVLDILETALATEIKSEGSNDAISASLANFRKGIEMTATEFKNVLARHGVNEVPSHGQPFDPAVHEALSSEETADVAPGSIARVYKKAYKMHDRVVRPGQVVVAKAKS